MFLFGTKLKNKIIINNKGELLFSEKDFGKRSEARNRLLTDLLIRTDFMEKAGTGIQRITDVCKINNNNFYFRFTDAFWITLYSNNVTENVTENREVLILEIISKKQNIIAT